MNQWYSKELGDGVDALAPSNRIKQAFLLAFISAGQPVDMAIFSRYDTERNIVTVYFSPAANALAKAFGAMPCEKPRQQKGLSLLAGDLRCTQALYQA